MAAASTHANSTAASRRPSSEHLWRGGIKRKPE